MAVKTQFAPDRNVKTRLAFLVALAMIVLALFFGTGGTTGLAERPGLFGTQANLFSDLNLIAQILFLLGLSVGAYFARKGSIPAHQYMQTSMFFFNLVLTILIMVVAYTEYVAPNLPENLARPMALVSTIHGLIGVAAILCGGYLLLRMNGLLPQAWRISWWRSLMRFTFGLYWAAGLIGLVTYYVWYMH
jgi:uncharacterized membrane protein